MGDSERWQATPAASGDPRNPVPHVAIKPQAPSIRTNLAIYTTRHIYHACGSSSAGLWKAVTICGDLFDLRNPSLMRSDAKSQISLRQVPKLPAYERS